MNIIYSIIVPVFNEESVIDETYKRIKTVMDSCNKKYEIIFVNDGSKDTTAEKARKICSTDPNIKLINFSRNFGHQPAITAGMNYASGQAIVVIDSDLQDPPEIILDMIKKWEEGYQIVYGKRIKREGETFFKKVTASTFYRLLNSLTDVTMPVDVGDFRLIDRKVCDTLNTLPEHNRYIRGLVSWVGFKQTSVEFVREKRFSGETKYPLKKMLKFATDGLLSFSGKPLKIATYVGILSSGFGFIYLLYLLFLKLFTRHIILSLSFILPSLFFLNGIILICLGIIGEYISRIYDESKNRPLYIINSTEGFTSIEKKSSH